MQLPLDSVLDQQLQRWSRYLVVCLVLIAFVVLIGWQLDIVLLKTFFLPPVAMNPLTAIGFILLGFSVWLFITNASTTTAQVLAILVIVIGLLRFGDLFLG